MAIIVSAMEGIYEDTVGETPEETRRRVGLLDDEDLTGDEIAFVGEEETIVSEDDIAESEDSDTVEAMANALESLIDTQTQQLTSSLEAYGIAADMINPNLTDYQRNKRVHALEGYSDQIGTVVGLESNDENKPGILKRIWEWFKKTLSSVKDMLKKAWEWFINLFNREEKKAKAMIQYIKSNVDKVEITETVQEGEDEVVEAPTKEVKDESTKPEVKSEPIHSAVNKANLTITLPQAQLRHIFLSSQKPLPEVSGDVKAADFLSAVDRTAKVMGDNVMIALKDNGTEKLVKVLANFTSAKDMGELSEKVNDYITSSKNISNLVSSISYKEAALPNGKCIRKNDFKAATANSQGAQLVNQLESNQYSVVDNPKAEQIQEKVTVRFSKQQLLMLVAKLEETVIIMSRFKRIIADANKVLSNLENATDNITRIQSSTEDKTIFTDTVAMGIKRIFESTIRRIQHPAFDLQKISMNFFLTLLRIINTFGFELRQQLNNQGNKREFTP
jgi:hypothetical protein